MKRVFLSLPMSGRTDEEIEKQIEEMKRLILESKIFGDEEVAFIDNFTSQISYRPIPVRQEPLLYLSKAVDAMAYVDYVFFGNGWVQARGCCAERDVALSYGIPVIDCSSIAHLMKVKPEEVKGEEE